MFGDLKTTADDALAANTVAESPLISSVEADCDAADVDAAVPAPGGRPGTLTSEAGVRSSGSGCGAWCRMEWLGGGGCCCCAALVDAYG